MLKLVVLVLLFYYIFLNKRKIEGFMYSEQIISEYDGNSYEVLNIYGGKKKAAGKLGMLNLYILSLIKFMKQKYIVEKQGTVENQNFTRRLLIRYNPDAIAENFVKSGEIINTSFVQNKGEEIRFCLREKESGESNIHNNDILQFVALHELTHIGSLEYGHDDIFWKEFKFILINAEEARIYKPFDYGVNNQNYCGLAITYNPYFDNTIK